MRPTSIPTFAILLLPLAVSPALAQDFNGDGYADLAIGVPYEDIGTVHDAGCVNVIYGSNLGLDVVGDQLWSQASPGMPQPPRANNAFGSSLAWGDFDDDGYDDLAIGAPFEAAGTLISAGSVTVLYGRAGGLSTSRSQFWSQDSLLDQPEEYDHFGSVLETGDFDGDGYSDLAVGVPLEEKGGARFAGAVNVIYGSAAGLSIARNQFWNQNVAGVPDIAEFGDQFGYSLASGDFNGDSFDDLAIGVPGESVVDMTNAGAVNVLYGSATGLAAAGSQLWSQDTPGLLGIAASNDVFGTSLAAGDTNHDGFDELAVGVPYDAVDGQAAAGAVQVILGSAVGLRAAGNKYWSQNTAGVLGEVESEDAFGWALVMADFNGDGCSDLAIGIPGEDLNVVDCGIVAILYGGAGGISSNGNQVFEQHLPAMLDDAEREDQFGLALAAGDYDGDRAADLAVGVPGEDLEAVDCGAVATLYGVLGAGLSVAGNQLWGQGTSDIEGDPETQDLMGRSL